MSEKELGKSKNNSKERSNFSNQSKHINVSNAGLRTKGKGIIEDSTEYGEFIASFDAWMTPEEQKRRAHHLEDLGKWVSDTRTSRTWGRPLKVRGSTGDDSFF